jgi:hypothetical protein
MRWELVVFVADCTSSGIGVDFEHGPAGLARGFLE